MASPAGPFQAAKIAALRASSTLAAAMGMSTPRLYVVVPENAKLPYVVGDDDQVLQDAGLCGDEAEIYATLKVWSRPATPDDGAQARAIGAAVIEALNQPLGVAGWTVDMWDLQSENYATDADQSTQGVLVFRYLLVPQT